MYMNDAVTETVAGALYRN